MRRNIAITLIFISISTFSQEIIVDSISIKRTDITLLGGNEAKDKEDPICVYSNGSCMIFPKSGLLSLYNPALGWSIYQCTFSDGSILKEESMILITNARDTYYSFDSNSRILMRFTDESISTLHRDLKDEVENKYDNIWLGNTLMHCYFSYVRLQLDSETRTKLLNPSLGIKKIRIVFSNGNVEDYELKGKRIMKFPEELRQSYREASQKNEIRTKNSNDSNF